MTRSFHPSDADLQASVRAVLEENRLMSVATLRADGWPQVTIVGYAHDGLTLYFAVARSSQKLANIERDPRISIAIGRDGEGPIRGLSMAAMACEVTDPHEIDRLNALIARSYPEQTVFAPREVSCAVIRVSPRLISVVDLSKGQGHPELFEVETETVLRRRPEREEGAGPSP